MSGFTNPALLRLLRCPHCADALRASIDGARSRRLFCLQGHSFDVSRQGHVNLAGGRGAALGDTAEMVSHRLAAFDAGHFEPLAAALAQLVSELPAGPIVDVGAGPGYYLARVLEAQPHRVGLALDISVPAAKRAARAHDRIGSVVADLRAGLPLVDDQAAVVLDVFAPRNAAEFQRVLSRDGRLLVVTPTGTHLQQLLETVGAVQVDPRKRDRLRESLSPRMALVSETHLTWPLRVTARHAGDLMAMGPTGHHLSPAQIARRLSDQSQWRTEAAVEITVWQPI